MNNFLFSYSLALLCFQQSTFFRFLSHQNVFIRNSQSQTFRHVKEYLLIKIPFYILYLHFKQERIFVLCDYNTFSFYICSLLDKKVKVYNSITIKKRLNTATSHHIFRRTDLTTKQRILRNRDTFGTVLPFLDRSCRFLKKWNKGF